MKPRPFLSFLSHQRIFSQPQSLIISRSFSSSPSSRSTTPSTQAVQTRQFYRSFTRPTLKILTLAFLTYQTVYWAWMRLENEDFKREKKREVETLEREVRVKAGLENGDATKRLLDDKSGRAG